MKRLDLSRPWPVSRATLAPPASRPKLGNGHGGPVAATASAAKPGAPGDVSMAHWNDLMDAVAARLRLLGSEVPAAGEAARDGMLQCAAALDQLHATMVHELGRHHRLELELFDARMALALMRCELAGTRAGERHARHQALHDGLTMLPNRTHFRARLQATLAASGAAPSSLAVLYIDLDGFKPINDLHGHATGDELLRIVAARLARAVRAEDLVGRLGGDEFACLIANVPCPQPLGQLARKLFVSVAEPLSVGALQLKVRPSIGIALCPTDADTAEALLQCADAAMYRAKRLQLGHAFFDRSADVPAVPAAARAMG